MSKIIMADEGQGDNERVEVLARKIKNHLSGARISEVRAGVEKAINERKARQARADKLRNDTFTERAKEFGFKGVSGLKTAINSRTHIVVPNPEYKSKF